MGEVYKMNDNAKQPWLSHEQKNLITSIFFGIVGIVAGFNAGQVFISEYIVSTIGFMEWLAFMLFWTIAGAIAGFQLGRLMWCTCGI